MAVNVAFAAPVNLPGQEPVLSAEDVWNGIVATVKRPQDFVDYISETEILQDEGLTLRRILHFRPGGAHSAPGGTLDQFITMMPNHKVEFVAAATGKATMAVLRDASSAEDAGGDENEIQVYLMQSFEVPYPPGVITGSEEARKQFDHLSKVARTNVLSNISSFRKHMASK